MTLQELAHNLPAIRDEAKALWGEEPYHASPYFALPTYLHHLVMMLLSDNPTQYLKENTPEKD